MCRIMGFLLHCYLAVIESHSSLEKLWNSLKQRRFSKWSCETFTSVDRTPIMDEADSSLTPRVNKASCSLRAQVAGSDV